MAFFDLVLQTGGSLHPDGEPDDFVSEYTGYIRCTRGTGRTDRVGKVHAHRIHAALACDRDESLFDVCDSHSHELHVVHTLLYEPHGYGFREPLVRRFEAVEADCLVLDYVVLHPKWRGLKLGLLAVRKLVDLVGGGCGLAVSDVSPLNPNAHRIVGVPASWIPRHGSHEERREGARSLRRHFRRMGFERLGKTPYYALPMARMTPSGAELLQPKA